MPDPSLKSPGLRFLSEWDFHKKFKISFGDNFWRLRFYIGFKPEGKDNSTTSHFRKKRFCTNFHFFQLLKIFTKLIQSKNFQTINSNNLF